MAEASKAIKFYQRRRTVVHTSTQKSIHAANPLNTYPFARYGVRSVKVETLGPG